MDAARYARIVNPFGIMGSSFAYYSTILSKMQTNVRAEVRYIFLLKS